MEQRVSTFKVGFIYISKLNAFVKDSTKRFRA